MHEEGQQTQLPHEREYRKLLGLDIYLTPVFVISSIVILIFIVGALVFQEGATKLFGDIRTWLTTNLDWLFMITANLVFLFCLVVAISPLGKVRLGGADAKPEYSNLTWLAMLFAAGIGIGLLFFGVSEPMYYLANPPLGIEADSAEAAKAGIAATVFHWGLHGWAVYGVVGLALGYFAFNRGFPSHYPIGIPSVARRPRLGMAGAYHRHVRYLCRSVRVGNLARIGGSTGNDRHELSV